MVTLENSTATGTDFTITSNESCLGMTITWGIYTKVKNILKRGLFFETKEEMSNFFARLSWVENFKYLVTQFIPKKKFKIKQDIGWKQNLLNKRRYALQAL